MAATSARTSAPLKAHRSQPCRWHMCPGRARILAEDEGPKAGWILGRKQQGGGAQDRLRGIPKSLTADMPARRHWTGNR